MTHLPTVHHNGTSKDELVQALCDAGAAISDACDKLQATAPNGRDHYLTPGTLKAAQAVHDARMKALKDVLASLEEDAFAISQSGD